MKRQGDGVMEGIAADSGDAVRVAVYWGKTLLSVSQVSDPRGLTAAQVFGQGISAAGVSPQLKLFSNPVSTKSRVDLGALTLIAEPIIPAARLSGFSMPEDWSFFKVAAMTALAMGALLVTISLTPAEDPAHDDDYLRSHVKVVRTAFEKPKPPPVLAKTMTAAKQLQSASPGPQAPEKRSEAAAKTDNRVDINDQGLLAVARGKAIGALLGPGKGVYEAAIAGLRQNHNVAVGPGNGLGERRGKEGLPGFEGLGVMGGWTKGQCVEDCGSGPGGLGIGNLGKEAVVPNSAPKEIVGGLSKSEIQRVVRAHQSEIKFCYEKALQKDPALGGKVAVLFEIDPMGGVFAANVAESTLNNDTAEACILAKIRRWKFPEPEGGGVVHVTYPWVFSSAGKNE